MALENLPGPWDERTKYLVPGKVLNAFRNAALANRVRCNDGTLVVNEGAKGTLLGINPDFRPVDQDRLPFAIYVDDGDIVAAPGVLAGSAIAATTEASPADGTWYLQAKVTINTSTAAITARAVEWNSTEQSTASPNFYRTIGTVVVSGGTPGSIIQNDWGPIVALPYGAAGDIWQVELF